MIFNLFLFIVLELASGFTQNLSQFLAVRALYGICMGVSVLNHRETDEHQLIAVGFARSRCCHCT